MPHLPYRTSAEDVPVSERLAATARHTDSVTIEGIAVTGWGSGRGNNRAYCGNARPSFTARAASCESAPVATSSATIWSASGCSP